MASRLSGTLETASHRTVTYRRRVDTSRVFIVRSTLHMSSVSAMNYKILYYINYVFKIVLMPSQTNERKRFVYGWTNLNTIYLFKWSRYFIGDVKEKN